MNRPSKSAKSKVAFALALGAAGLSATWVWLQQDDLGSLQGVAISPVLSGAVYVGTGWPSLEPTVAAWPKAPVQSQGGGWLYEVFTPPVIYYNAAARTFAVTPPQFPAASPSVAMLGLELLAVKPKPYRLQLLGYFGPAGDYLAAFGCANSPETTLARLGHRFEQLGLTLKSFDVQKVIVESDDAGPVYDVAAFAVLYDELSGTEIVLDSRVRKSSETLLAVIMLPGASDRPRELQEGDAFADGSASYLIERIQLDPPEVVVSRNTPGQPVPEMQVLRPSAQFVAETIKPKAFAPQPAQVVATTRP